MRNKLFELATHLTKVHAGNSLPDYVILKAAGLAYADEAYLQKVRLLWYKLKRQ